MCKCEKDVTPLFTAKDVTVHEKKRIFKQRFAIDQYIVSYKKFSGGETGRLLREIFERDANAVAILPYDPVTDEVVLIEQFRPGALNDPVSPWLLEIVAGMIDKGETPIQAALRELEEESGIKMTEDHLHYVNAVYPSPGGTSEVVTLYIGCVNSDNIGSHGGLDCEDEDIRVFKLKAEDAFLLCDSGRICNCAALVSLMYLRIHKDRIQKAFLKLRN